MATIDKKQKRWYSKSTFDSLDKTTIPVGTEIQVTGELGQADFDSDTNTKLNAVPNKLDKPSGNPTEDSLVKVSSTGSVEYVTYKKYYRHEISFSASNGKSYQFSFISSDRSAYTIDTLGSVKPSSSIYCEISGEYGGFISEYDASTHIFRVNNYSAELTVVSLNDIVREL